MLFFGDIHSNLICMEALEGDISNLCCVDYSTVAAGGFQQDKIKRGLMLMREIPWSTPSVERAHGSAASSHELHPMMGSEMIARRTMLHKSRALFFPDAEDRWVVNRQKASERLRRKRPRKTSWRQAYFRALMLEMEAVSRSAPHSSQVLKERTMAQHVKLLNALSPSDKQGLGHDSRRPLVRARSQHRAGCAAQCGRGQLCHIERLRRARGVLPDAACQHGSFGI